MDARKLEQIIIKPKVDAIITSPPYYNLKDYGYPEQIGFGRNYSDYLDDLANVFSQCYKVSKQTASMWVIIDTFKENGRLMPLPLDICAKMNEKKIGWILRDIIIWNKGKTLPWSRKGQLRNIFEYILFFTKSDNYKYYIDRIKISDPAELKEWWVKYPERYNPLGKVPSDIWTFLIPTQGSWGHGFLRHFNPFPIKLIERILLLSTDEGDVILDPFAGSGAVLAVAENMNRKAIGLEMKEEYVNMYKQHVRKEVSEEFDIRKKELATLEETRRKLEDLIKRLRLLKYPKTLVRRLQLQGITHKELPINSIFVIANAPAKQNSKSSSNKFHFLNEDIFLLLERDVNRKKLIKEIQPVMSKPPLSKFGISANLSFFTREEFLTMFNKKPLFDENQLWMYVRGTFFMFHSKTSLERWKQESKLAYWRDYFRNGVPPILSNIRVYQNPINSKKIILREPELTINDLLSYILERNSSVVSI